MLKNIAVVVMDGVAPFELGVLCEAFGVDRSDAGIPKIEFAVCGVTPGPVETSMGFSLVVGEGLDRVAEADLVAVPAMPRDAGYPEPVLEALRAANERGARVMSVCTGAFVLAAAGLLDGRRCTTHHAVQDDLAARHPRAHVVRDVLFTTDGGVVTSAGIASGIDLSLHLLAMRHGPALAARVAREMVVYARRNGTEPQASAMLRHRSHVDDTVHRVQDRIDEQFASNLPLADLAAQAGVADRTLTRLFTRATGVTPLRYQQQLRLERAEHLIGHGATVESAAHTVGFQDPRMLRRLRSQDAAAPKARLSGARAAVHLEARSP